MKYTTKQIEDAANTLRALPPKKRTKNPSSKKAVQMLQTEFAALLERGYSLAQAGRALHNAGIQISPLTLLVSLGGSSSSPKARTSRTKPTPRAPAKPRVAKRSSVPADPLSTTTSPAAPEPAARRVPPPPLPSLPSLPPPPAPFLTTQRAAAIPPTQPNPVFQRGNSALPKATFQVRPDTPDSEL